MILGFKPQFVDPILNGTKIHTIRKSPKRIWRRGKTIHMATGVRTPNYNCFNQTICSGAQRVFMTLDTYGQLNVSIDGRELFGYHEKTVLAMNDGFYSWEELEDWFVPVLKEDEDETFSGQLIHWTEFRYKK